MDYENRINTALGKILRNFNYLELNLGLRIRFIASSLGDKRDLTQYDGYLKRSGLPELTSRLKKLIDKCDHVPSSKEYKKWMQRAEKLRVLRNFYVHGTWEYVPNRKEGPLEFHLPPWRTEEKDKTCMNLEDFERDAQLSEEIFIEFLNICKKYKI